MRIDPTKSSVLLLGGLLAFGANSGIAAGTDATTSQQSATSTTSPQPSTAKSTAKRGPLETVSDATITAKVKAALAADDTVKARKINVDTVGGIVTLSGSVTSATEKEQALKLARQVKGVADVNDKLQAAG
jgi:hyperosmotically inducible periplasmic protein